MRIRRTVKERDIMKVWVFGCDRKFIKSAADSGFRNMSEVLSYDFGKRVKDLASLPEEVIKYIKIITT